MQCKLRTSPKPNKVLPVGKNPSDMDLILQTLFIWENSLRLGLKLGRVNSYNTFQLLAGQLFTIGGSIPSSSQPHV